jgi:hypothetical protein
MVGYRQDGKQLFPMTEDEFEAWLHTIREV